MLLVGDTRSPALVLMRDAATGQIRKFVAVLDDGTTAEASANSEGRLGEFVLGEHRFVFTDYTSTHVTATYYAPSGGVVSELIELAGSAAALTAPGAIASSKVRGLSRAEAMGPFDDLVDEALEWVADASNTYLPLTILRTAGETVAERFEQVRSGVNQVLAAGATQLQDVVHNALSCETPTLAGCARETAEQVETLIDELAVLDPDAETTAGFEVTETGVQPILEEWQPVLTPEDVTS
ncbi:MAG TPA: hypothetical protein VHF69_07300, partial [Candidatus Synoicihabitans sp.]|nr:hypothetical protein [Candidatus Synoicihabitans sp.]